MILTIKQIYQHYEHIEKITLQSYEMPYFLTHRISLNRVVNSNDYVLILYPLKVLRMKMKYIAKMFTYLRPIHALK